MNFPIFIRSIVNNVLLSIIGVLLFVISFQIVFFTFDDWINPIEAADMVIDKVEYYPGDKINYVAVLKRQKACPSEIQRFVISRQPQTKVDPRLKLDDIKNLEFLHVWYRDKLIGTLELGNYYLIGDITLPNNIPAGQYTFVVYSITQCTLLTRTNKYPTNTFYVKTRPI